MSDFKKKLSAVRFNPMLMQNVALDELERQLTGLGEYDIPNAGNPFAFLLEASTLTTSVGISEGEALLRRLYPRMAQTPEELYLHMSDEDYIGRFASPAWTTFELYLNKDEVLRRAIPVGDQGVRQLTIPRLSSFTVADTTFTMQYAIDIKVMAHGGIQVVYKTDLPSPIQTLESNMVDWDLIRFAGGELMVLRVPTGQFKVDTFTETLNAAAGFKTSYGYSDQFYYARVYLSRPDGSWQEIRTTHTDQVYDYREPTAVLQVQGQSLTVQIPIIYFTIGSLTGEVRVDIYTTKGRLELDPGSYQPGQFTYELIDIDDDVTYVSPLKNLTQFHVLNPNSISGGANRLSFEELRDRVINNSLGTSRVPITHAQLEVELESRGYTLVTNIDNITNRQFLASKRLSSNSSAGSVSNMGCMMGQLQITMDELALSDFVIDNGQRVTITPDMLYKYERGVIKPTLDSTIHTLRTLKEENGDALVRNLTGVDYLYSPLHYVLDANHAAFDVRPYYMDRPEILRKTFVDENNTALMQVSVDEHHIERTEEGYLLTVKVKSGEGFKAMLDSNIVVQLGYRPRHENSYASINGVLDRIEDEERVYTFEIHTDFDIDSSHGLYTTNLTMFDSLQHNFSTDLLGDWDISFIVLNHISLGYTAGELDLLVQTHLLPSDRYMVVSRERLNIRLGYDLTSLWRRNRSLISEASYRRYEHDVPYLWTETIYKRDENNQIIIEVAEDGELVYEVLHHKDDPVLDDEGEPVYRYKKGEVILDANGRPELIAGRKILREFTMLLVDGLFYFVTDPQSIQYRDSVPMEIIGWIENDLDLISRRLLEQSELYLYPTNTIGNTPVAVKDGETATISLGQSLTVNYYIHDVAYSNASLRSALIQSTREILGEVLNRTTVSVSDIITRLKANAGDDVISIDVAGLGGPENYSVVTIQDQAVRLSLGKRLVVLTNQLVSVQDDVTINFLRHN